MAFSFEVELEQDCCVRTKLDDVKKMADQSMYNLKLVGDEASGEIQGIVKGDYVVEGHTLKMCITKKPMIISNGKIQQMITSFFVANN